MSRASAFNDPALLDRPALAPPPGVTPNFTNPANLARPWLAGLQFGLITTFVCIRLYTKKYVVGRWLAEDWWLFASYICSIGNVIVIFILLALPLGVHQWDMTIRKAMDHAKIFHIASWMYCLTILHLKVAIILQIRRVVVPRQLRHEKDKIILRRTVNVFLAINVLFYLSMLFFLMFECVPLRKVWDFRVPGKCVKDKLVVNIISGVINTASDIIMVIIPQPVIWGLTMERRKKWGLSIIFLLGGIACATSIVRLYWCIRVYSATDRTYTAALMGKWSFPEVTCGYLAICLPVVPNFIKHITHSAFGQKLKILPGHGRTASHHQNSGLNDSNRRSGPIATIGSGRDRKKSDFDNELLELTRSVSLSASCKTVEKDQTGKVLALEPEHIDVVQRPTNSYFR